MLSRARIVLAGAAIVAAAGGLAVLLAGANFAKVRRLAGHRSSPKADGWQRAAAG